MNIYNQILKSINNELTKTHDGTSMGKIGPIMDDWATAPGNYDSMCLFDKEGRRVNQTFKPSGYGGSFADLWDKYRGIPEAKDLHWIQQPHYSMGHYKESENDKGYEIFAHYNLERLITEKNDNGDYMFQGIHTISPNGIRQSLIRNNKYSPADDEAFNNAVKHYKQAIGDYTRLWNKTEISARGEGVDSCKEAVKQIGTLPQYLKEVGVLDDFEKANCKMRFNRNNYGKEVDRRFEDWEPGTFPKPNRVNESEKPSWAKGV